MISKKTLLKSALVLSLGLGASAHAGPGDILFDPDGGGAAGSFLLDTFDWSPASALADNSLPNAVGDTFQLYASASLGTFNLDGNVLSDQHGLNTTYEITAVVSFGQETVGIATNGTFASVSNVFDATAATLFEIYISPIDHDALTGSGYNNGTLLMSGQVSDASSTFFIPNIASVVQLDQFGADDWGTSTLAGTGGSSLSVSIGALDFVNSDYFLSDITGANFNTSTVTPFLEADPTECFINAAGGVEQCDGTFDAGGTGVGGNGGLGGTTANIGLINGGGEDFLFQADANQSFVVVEVPEPASLALLGFGLGALGFTSRRRARKAKQA